MFLFKSCSNPQDVLMRGSIHGVVISNIPWDVLICGTSHVVKTLCSFSQKILLCGITHDVKTQNATCHVQVRGITRDVIMCNIPQNVPGYAVTCDVIKHVISSYVLAWCRNLWYFLRHSSVSNLSRCHNAKSSRRPSIRKQLWCHNPGHSSEHSRVTRGDISWDVPVCKIFYSVKMPILLKTFGIPCDVIIYVGTFPEMFKWILSLMMP